MQWAYTDWIQRRGISRYSPGVFGLHSRGISYHFLSKVSKTINSLTILSFFASKITSLGERDSLTFKTQEFMRSGMDIGP
jgi:hypothetical protein